MSGSKAKKIRNSLKEMDVFTPNLYRTIKRRYQQIPRNLRAVDNFGQK